MEPYQISYFRTELSFLIGKYLVAAATLPSVPVNSQTNRDWVRYLLGSIHMKPQLSGDTIFLHTPEKYSMIALAMIVHIQGMHFVRSKMPLVTDGRTKLCY